MEARVPFSMKRSQELGKLPVRGNVPKERMPEGGVHAQGPLLQVAAPRATPVAIEGGRGFGA
eukprot:4053633-Lingulodinium_polyedra.AAC.1